MSDYFLYISQGIIESNDVFVHATTSIPTSQEDGKSVGNLLDNVEEDHVGLLGGCDNFQPYDLITVVGLTLINVVAAFALVVEKDSGFP